MQTLTVKNIEEKHTKDGTKSFFIITDNTGASFSLWEPIGMIKPGCVLEVDVEVKGKYANIQSFTIKSQPPSNTPAPIAIANGKPAYGQDSPEKRRSIERQTSITQAIEWLNYYNTERPSLHELLSHAEAFYQWISQGTIPPPPKTSTSEPSKSGDVKADPPSPAPKQAEEPPVEKKAVVYKTDPATIKDKLAFQRACHKDFGLNDPREITRELNIGSLQDIADWGDAYKTIATVRG